MASSLCGRALMWGALLVGLAVLAPPVQAQDPTPVRLPGEPLAGPMALSVDDTGRLVAAWWSLTADSPVLLSASTPAFAPAVIAQPGHEAPPLAATPLALGPQGQVAWALIRPQGATLWQRTPAGAVMELELSLLPSALSFAASGELYWAGHDDGQVVVGSFAQPAPRVIGALQQVSELALCVAADEHLWVAATGTDAAGREGLYLYDGDAAPLLVTAEGHEPRLLCDGDGVAHLAWRQGAGLGYASGVDWSQTGLLAAPDVLAWALAHDRDAHAYLAWATAEGLWLASDLNWAPQRVLQAPEMTTDGLALAVGATGVPHLLWQGAGRDGARTAQYVALSRAPAQLQVVAVGQQGVLTSATRLQVISNLPPAEIEAVDFYLVARSGLLARAWRWFATDSDGQDGFVAQAPADLLHPGEAYAVAVQARTADGRALVAQSDWLHAESDWPAILAAPELATWRGVAEVRLLPLQERERDEIYELWLRPPAERLAVSTPIYLGAHVLPASAAAGEWFAWPVDARLAPDGHYNLYATIATEEGSAQVAAASQVTIDNACPPQITAVNVEIVGRARDRLRVRVDAQDLNGRIERVDMFLLPRSILGDEEGAPAVWLGSDTSATGGWSLEVALQPEWRGGEWAVRAVAYDNDDLPSAQALSSQLFLPPQGLQVRFVRPDAGRLIAGSQMVTLVIDEGVARVERVTFHLQDAAGVIRQVSVGRLDIRLATGEIDARALPDGRYRLLANVEADGVASLWPGPEITVDSRRPWVALDGPQDEPLYGQVRHTVRVQRAVAPIVRAEFTLRDARSAVALLGHDDTPADGWQVVWDARQFMPGDYTLGCVLTDSRGDQSLHEWPLSIASRHAIAGPFVAERLEGVVTVGWDASALPADAVLALDYSPDGGAHWLNVGQVTAGDATATVDTTQLPDSRAARLGLFWAAGPAWAVSSSATVVENHNERPHLAVLTPQPGDKLPRQALIGWEASDPDSDALEVAIWARQGEGEWQVVAEELPNSGRYEWDTSTWPQGRGWELRVVARDERGAIRETQVGDLTLTHNRPPTVRLVWPHAEVALNGETVVLWSAFDLDGDEVLIDLYYSDNAGQAWYTLAEGLPNTGYYSWETAFVPPGSAYAVRVVARDGQTMQRTQSSGLSTIGDVAQADARFVLPQQDAALRRATAICWRTTNSVGGLATVAVEARETRTGAIEPITANGPLTGCMLWNTLYVPDGHYELLLVGRDAEGVALTRLARPVQVRNLALSAPRAAWLSPLPTGPQAGPVALRWQAWAPDGHAMSAQVQVSRDAGLTWEIVGEAAAGLGMFIWQSRAEAARVRLLVQDVRGSQASLSPLLIDGGEAGVTPEITLSLARAEQERAVRWLARDAGDRDLNVSVVRRYSGGEAELLLAGQTEVGELLLPLQPAQQAEICVLADNGIVSGLTCEQLTPPEAWRVLPTQPVVGAALGDMVAVRWNLTGDAGGTLPETQRVLASFDGRQTWTLLDELPPDARQYDWDTTPLPAGHYWLRVEAARGERLGAAEWGPFQLGAEARPRAAISLTGLHLAQPVSGAWTLHWQSWRAPAGARVNLAYRTAPNGPWRTLTRGLPPTGRLVWDMAALANGSRIWLRAELETPGGSVYHAPALPLTLANGQLPTLRLSIAEQDASLADQRSVCWQSQGVSARATVRLSFSPDGGASWATLADGLPAAGCEQASLQALQGSWPLLRAVVTDSGQQGLDTVSMASRWW